MVENFARDFFIGVGGFFKAVDVLAMIIYVTTHGVLLTLEMFTLHVALTSSEESVFAFLFYNNFTELKITVFKKVNSAGLFQYIANDSVEILQLIIYLSNILVSTS